MGFFSLFPAYAGVILQGCGAWVGIQTFPRIRGGDPVDRLKMKLAEHFSPHTRG